MENQRKTILIVDDEPTVVSFVSTVLVDYNLLTANSGLQAIQEARRHEADIDLLLTDFMMPGMSGADLALQLTTERPELKVLIMSGFTKGIPVLDEVWHFVAKPFTPSNLRMLVSNLIFQQP